VFRAIEFESRELQKKRRAARRKLRRGGSRVLSYSALRIMKTILDTDKAKLAWETTADPHTP